MSDDPGAEWTERDTINLNSFLIGATGQKLLKGWKHTVYLEIMDPKKKTEWDDGRRSGMATLIVGTENLSIVDEIPLEGDEETTE